MRTWRLRTYPRDRNEDVSYVDVFGEIRATQTCGGGEPALGSGVDMILSDTDCFERALREHRETSWDDSSFEELPFEVQQTILRRAQEIKECQHRLQAVLGVRHPIAS